MNKTTWLIPISIVLASIILGSFYSINQIGRQNRLQKCFDTAQYLNGEERLNEREFCIRAYK